VDPTLPENGPARHLAVLFRHLGYDSTEPLRDVNYSAAQVAFLNVDTLPEGYVRYETKAGIRHFLYKNINLEEFVLSKRKV
jgi:hypothetical protein